MLGGLRRARAARRAPPMTSTRAAPPPRPCELLPGPRERTRAARRRASPTSEIRLRVPAVDADHYAHGRIPPVRVDQRSASVSASRRLADERVREQRAEDALAAAAQRRVERELLVGGDVRDEPALERPELRQLERPTTVPPPTCAGTSTTASSARNGSAPPLRTLIDVPAAARSCRAGSRSARRRPRSSPRRRAATAAPASRRAPRPRRGAAAPPRCARHDLGARLVRPPLLDERRRGRRSSGGSTTARCRGGARAAPGRPVARATRSACSSRAARQDVVAVEPHADLPRQVVEPEWSSSIRSGVDVEHLREVALEDHRGAAEADGAMARVEQRLRDDADRVREVDDPRVRRSSSRTRSAMSSTTGTVRSAFASPPKPVVSWPMQPHASGTDSSTMRAACPPTRIWMSTASAPSTASSRLVVERSRVGCAGAVEHAPREPATRSASRCSFVSCSAQVVDRQQVDAAARSRRSTSGV